MRKFKATVTEKVTLKLFVDADTETEARELVRAKLTGNLPPGRDHQVSLPATDTETVEIYGIDVDEVEV